jgi:hypothetical protein
MSCNCPAGYGNPCPLTERECSERTYSSASLDVERYWPLNYNGVLSDFNRLETGSPLLTISQGGEQEINLGAAEAAAVYYWLGQVLTQPNWKQPGCTYKLCPSREGCEHAGQCIGS